MGFRKEEFSGQDQNKMEALHKMSFGKSVFAMSCRQDNQGQRKCADKGFVLTAHKARLPCPSGRTGSFRSCQEAGQHQGRVGFSQLRK